MKGVRKNSLLWFAVGAFACAMPSQSLAQFPEDALRFATPGLGVGARALGMGNAYTGVANDYSALFWNPAGLAQIEHGEFSFGLSHHNNKDLGAYLGTGQSYSNNSTTLNALGVVLPVETKRGSLVFALGYNRNSNFTTGLSYGGALPLSIAQDFAPDRGTIYRSDLEGNLAYRLYLADTLAGSGHWVRFTNSNNRPDSTFAYFFDSPIKNALTQSLKILEGGGANNWSIGGAIDIAKNVSAGLTLNYLSGSYKYEQTYLERDAQNQYNSTNETDSRNFDNFVEDYLVEGELTGFNAKLGLMIKQPERYRMGLTVKSPTVLHVKEAYGWTYTSAPDFGKVATVTDDGYTNEYDVATPWVFGGGASIILNQLVLSGDVEYTDWTQLEFRNANADLLAKNKRIKDLFRATANLRGGAEYDIENAGLRLRAGFIYNTSPYRDDPSSYDQKYATAGLGIRVSESTMLDLGYAYGWWKTFRNDYRGLGSVNENITTNNFMLTFSYRY